MAGASRITKSLHVSDWQAQFDKPEDRVKVSL